MEKSNNKVNIPKQKHKHHAVHSFLAYSYLVYFFTLIVGITLNTFSPIKVFDISVMSPIGLVLLLLSSILILWAQSSSTDLLHKEDVTYTHFLRGPYRYTRMPTHFGLFLAIMGFGFIINSFFVIILTLIAFLITKFTFLKKQEDELEKKFGDAYREYKKKVKF